MLITFNSDCKPIYKYNFPCCGPVDSVAVQKTMVEVNKMRLSIQGRISEPKTNINNNKTALRL